MVLESVEEESRRGDLSESNKKAKEEVQLTGKERSHIWLSVDVTGNSRLVCLVLAPERAGG